MWENVTIYVKKISNGFVVSASVSNDGGYEVTGTDDVYMPNLEKAKAAALSFIDQADEIADKNAGQGEPA